MSELVGFDSYKEIAGIGHKGGPKLRYYQEEAVNSLFSFFDEHGGTGPDGLPIKANPLVCLPTGTGKSLVIAEFIRRALMLWPNTRIIMSTHVKTLIEQNAAKMLEAWPHAPLGVVSAGLNRREYSFPIVFAGVQSAVKKFPLFGYRDLLIVDEAHLISPSADTSYLKLIEELTTGIKGEQFSPRNINPYLKVIGLTATPYRLGLGHMTNGNIFTHTAYDLCTIEGFNRLIVEGYLCPLIAKRTDTLLDVSKVGKVGGDYNQGELEDAVDKDALNYAILKESCEKGFDRASWLVFASGITHANHLCEMLNSAFGISAVTVHSGNSKAENDENLLAWKTGKVRAAVSMNSLTTGVDHPPCDFIIMTRPTMSPGLWVQMLGRGTRTWDFTLTNDPVLAEAFPFVKHNCLVLDFAGNTKRLGPINDPVIPKLKGSGPPGDSPVKTCEQCGTYNHASARECVVCGAEFPINNNLNGCSAGLDVLRSDLPQHEMFTVQHVTMTEHKASNGNESIKIAYFCGMRTFYEWKSVQSSNSFFRHLSRDWFRQRYHYNTKHLTWDNDVPYTNKEILALANELRHPKRIQVWINKEKPEISGYEF